MRDVSYTSRARQQAVASMEPNHAVTVLEHRSHQRYVADPVNDGQCRRAFLGDQFPVPSQQGLRGDDAGGLGKSFSPHALAFTANLRR